MSFSGIQPQFATVPASFARGSVDARQAPVQGRGVRQAYQHQAQWQSGDTPAPPGAPGLSLDLGHDPVPPPRSRDWHHLHRVSAGITPREPDAAGADTVGTGTGGTAAGTRAGRHTSDPDGATLSPQLLQPGLGLAPVLTGTHVQTHAQALRRPSLPHGTLPSLPSDEGLHSALTAALAGPRWVNGQRVSAAESLFPTDQQPQPRGDTAADSTALHASLAANAAGTMAVVDVDGGVGFGALGGVGGLGGDDSPGVLLPETPKVPFPISLRGGGDPFSRAVSPIGSNRHTAALFESHTQGEAGRTMFVDALLRSLGRETEALGSGLGVGSGPGSGLGAVETTIQSRSGVAGVTGTGGSAPNSPGAGEGSWRTHTPHIAGLGFELGHNEIQNQNPLSGTWTDHFGHFGVEVGVGVGVGPTVFSEPSSPTQQSKLLGGLPFHRSASAGPPPHPSSAPPLSTHFHFDPQTTTSNDARNHRADQHQHAWSALPSGQVQGQRPAQSQGGRAQAPGAGTTGGTAGSHFLPHSPALIALKKIRKPSLRTLISPLSSVTNSRAPSPIPEEQSPTLWNGPMQLDDVDELDGMGMGMGLGVGSGMHGASGAATWGVPSGSAASASTGTTGSAGSGPTSMTARQGQGEGQENTPLRNQEMRGQYHSAQGPGRNGGETLEAGHGAAEALGLMGLEGVFGA